MFGALNSLNEIYFKIISNSKKISGLITTFNYMRVTKYPPILIDLMINKDSTERLTRYQSPMIFEPNQNALSVTFSKNLYSYCLVLVGSRNRFQSDFTNKIK